VARSIDEAVRTLAAGRPLVLLLDVDGTLAPLAQRPEDARVPDETRKALLRLVSSPGVHLGLISGRAAADAHQLVAVQGVWVYGNHGAEWASPQGEAGVHPEVAAHEDAMTRAAVALTGQIGRIPGVLVEFKRWSLSIHYRLAARADVPSIVEAVHAVAEREGLRVMDGKEIIELRAPADVDKGTAVVALLDRLGGHAPSAAVAFVGDDVSDEDGFRRLRAEVPGAITIRVGSADVPTAARLVVPDTEDVRELLQRVADARGGAAASATAPPAR
jgi:trehalose-phosphatase